MKGVLDVLGVRYRRSPLEPGRWDPETRGYPPLYQEAFGWRLTLSFPLLFHPQATGALLEWVGCQGTYGKFLLVGFTSCLSGKPSSLGQELGWYLAHLIEFKRTCNLIRQLRG
jgi:hypothetical protein